jgi:NADPH:quinone reductase-like Zn-dependent oxidoreductase
MKASVIHQYGGPEVLKYEDYADPVAGEGQVLVRVAAAGINPVDINRRNGVLKDIFPIKLPGIIGADVSGTVVKLGAGVKGFSVGDTIFRYADQTYAELCAVPAANAAKVPDGLDVVDAAALPVVVTTGYQVVGQAGVKSGQTIFVSGAMGSVGRVAVYVAKSLGAKVLAGVRGKQSQQAKDLGVDGVIATDDDSALTKVPPLDAVINTVRGKLGDVLLAKVKKGGVFATIVGSPGNAKEYSAVRIAEVYAHPEPKVTIELARAVVQKKLAIPIGKKLPLSSAAEAHLLFEKGGVGKVLLIS